MQFTTPVPISKSSNPINYNSEILSLGSCFAVNIAEKFEYFQFKHTVNPFGILFHPLAIEKFIRLALEQKTFTESNVFFHNERWHSFDAHSDLSHTDKHQLLQNLNLAVQTAEKKIREATHIVITYGTAWVYRNTVSGNLVANCHKVPQKEFTKELLSVEAVAESIQKTISLLQSANPKAQILFTISPVRHLKDGFAENQWSKANLISGLHQTLQSGVNAGYFPSYETMMDELRDYRFYAEDMIHPNQIAIDYIWERFSESWISPDAYQVMDEVASIRKSLSHRAFNPDSESHKMFLAGIRVKTESLIERFPHMTF